MTAVNGASCPRAMTSDLEKQYGPDPMQGCDATTQLMTWAAPCDTAAADLPR